MYYEKKKLKKLVFVSLLASAFAGQASLSLAADDSFGSTVNNTQTVNLNGTIEAKNGAQRTYGVTDVNLQVGESGKFSAADALTIKAINDAGAGNQTVGIYLIHKLAAAGETNFYVDTTMDVTALGGTQSNIGIFLKETKAGVASGSISVLGKEARGLHLENNAIFTATGAFDITANDGGADAGNHTIGVEVDNSTLTLGAGSHISALPSTPLSGAAPVVDSVVGLKAANNAAIVLKANTQIDARNGKSINKGIDATGSMLTIGENAVVTANSAQTINNMAVHALNSDVTFENNSSITTESQSLNNFAINLSNTDAAHAHKVAIKGQTTITGDLKNAAQGGTFVLEIKEGAGLRKITGNVIVTGQGAKTDIVLADKDSFLHDDVNTDQNGMVNLVMNAGTELVGSTSTTDKAGTVAITMEGSMWNVTGHSALTELSGNAGAINLAHTAGGQKLFIDRLAGADHKFIIDVDTDDIRQGKQKTDFIKIENAAAPTTAIVELTKESVAAVAKHDFGTEADAKPIYFADAASNVTFTAGDAHTALYNYHYKVEKNVATVVPIVGSVPNGNLWFIHDVNRQPTPENDAAHSFMSYIYGAALPRVEMSSLQNRLGEIRDVAEKSGVWARVSGGSLTSNTPDFDFKDRYTMYQIGYDHMTMNESGKYFTGLALNTRYNKLSLTDSKGSSRNHGVSLYHTFVNNDNMYVDVVASFTKVNTEYNVMSKDKVSHADHNNWARGLSVEIGKKFTEGRYGKFIEHSLQLNYTNIKANDFSIVGENGKIDAHVDQVNSLIGKLGVRAGREFGRAINYVKLAVAHEFTGNYGGYFTTGVDNMTVKSYP